MTTDYRALFEATPAACLVLAPDLTIEAVTDAYLRATDRRREDITGRHLFEVFPDNPALPDADGVAKLRASLQRVLGSGAADRMPVQRYDITVGSGPQAHFEERYWDPVNTPMLDAQGRVTRIIHQVTDVTLQIKAQALEARFRTIADVMPQMVWSTLPDGSHDYFNQRWYDYTGVPEGSTDGEGWNGMFHPDDQDRAWERWRHSLATGDEYEIQYRLRNHLGEYRWVLGRALPLHDDAGKLIRWMGTCTDIHEQKLAEEELREGSRRKDEFLAMLAHELRNPLAPISSAAQLLRLPGMDEVRVRHASDVIGRQVRHMTELVDDLLDVSRVTRGQVQLERGYLDLKAVVHGAVEQASPLIEARHHRLLLDLPPERTVVLGDKTRLLQAIANLLNNAAKYTPQHGQITLQLAIDGSRVEVRVTDNGNGITAALMPHVFDLFTQGERTPDRAHGGLGLGLALVKSIAALHGGAVGVDSAGPGQGSTFTISLPLADEEALPLAVPADAAGATAAHPLHIVLVDDNQDGARALEVLLSAAGHTVWVAGDARGGLALATQHDIDAFVLDIGLPDMDGYALARRLRADARNGASLLIALTGYGQAHDRVLSMKAGFDHHFVKPVDAAALLALLSKRTAPSG